VTKNNRIFFLNFYIRNYYEQDDGFDTGLKLMLKLKPRGFREISKSLEIHLPWSSLLSIKGQG